MYIKDLCDRVSTVSKNLGPLSPSIAPHRFYTSSDPEQRFIKTLIEGVAAVIEYDPPSNISTVELVEEDKFFEEWSCTLCRRSIGNKVVMRFLDERLEAWRAEKDLCTVKSDYQRYSM